MAGGELGAVFRALARRAVESAERITSRMSAFTHETAGAVEENAWNLTRSDTHARTRLQTAARRGASVDDVKAAATTDPTSLFSRSGALSNREVVDQGIGLLRNAATVDHYASRAEVDFRGSPVEILDDEDYISYLDYWGAVARTDPDGVLLGPAAFQDEETLVRTLGHESIHVRQLIDGEGSTVTGPLEDEAYAAEDGFVETWRRNGG